MLIRCPARGSCPPQSLVQRHVPSNLAASSQVAWHVLGRSPQPSTCLRCFHLRCSLQESHPLSGVGRALPCQLRFLCAGGSLSSVWGRKPGGLGCTGKGHVPELRPEGLAMGISSLRIRLWGANVAAGEGLHPGPRVDGTEF